MKSQVLIEKILQFASACALLKLFGCLYSMVGDLCHHSSHCCEAALSRFHVKSRCRIQNGYYIFTSSAQANRKRHHDIETSRHYENTALGQRYIPRQHIATWHTALQHRGNATRQNRHIENVDIVIDVNQWKCTIWPMRHRHNTTCDTALMRYDTNQVPYYHVNVAFDVYITPHC